MNVLILGGTRFMGRRIARRLVGEGEAVTLLNRGNGRPVEGTRNIVGDRSRPDGLNGLREERFDSLVDLSGYESSWTRAALAALAGRVEHYVFISSGAVYEPSAELPWPESGPCTGAPQWGTYAREKLDSEHALWEAQDEGRMAVTSLRLPFVLGPENYADREAFVLGRIVERRPILLPGGGSAINQHVHVEDVATVVVAALRAREKSEGQAFNVAYRRGVTNRGFVALCGDALKIEPEVHAIDATAMGVASDVVDLTNLVFPFPESHYLLDVDHLARVLGVEAKFDNLAMISDFLDWWRRQPARPPIEYEREQRALAALKGMTPA